MIKKLFIECIKSTYRETFTKEGHGLNGAFFTMAAETSILIGCFGDFDDVIKCVELLRQAVRAAAIVKLGLL